MPMPDMPKKWDIMAQMRADLAQWGMGNGYWGMGNGEWILGNGDSGEERIFAALEDGAHGLGVGRFAEIGK